MKKNSETCRVIGTETIYIGHERRHGVHGAKVIITAIFRYDEDEDSDNRWINDNQQLADLGGVRAQDGAEIHTWLPKENRWCSVGDELESVLDLACFAGLKKAN